MLLLLWLLLGSMLVWWENVDARTLNQETPQNPPIIRRLHVQVMPEFDDPRVLVLVQGHLDVAEAEMPQTVTFYIPSDAQINQMASLNMTDGATNSHPYELNVDPEDARWSEVTYVVESAHFFYEYYYNPLDGEPLRTFTYTFRSALPVADMVVEVQQPHRSADFAVQPAAETTRTDDMLGFTYYQVSLGEVEMGGTTGVQVRYLKSDDDPSLSREELMLMQMGADADSEMAGAMQAEAGASARSSSWNTMLLGGLMLLGVGAFAWYRSRGDAQSPSEHKGSETVGEQAFCSQCGAALKAEARFCHVCGTSLISP